MSQDILLNIIQTSFLLALPMFFVARISGVPLWAVKIFTLVLAVNAAVSSIATLLLIWT